MAERDTVPVVPWDVFLRKHWHWAQGEHVAAIAPTGAGKTTLFRALSPHRDYNLFIGTKPDDKMYREMIRYQGYERVYSIDDIKPHHRNVLLWPKLQRTIVGTMSLQRKTFGHAMDVVVNQGAWTVWIDECKYLAEQLKLTTQLTYCLEQLRSIHATVVCGAQRPVWLPRSVLSSSSHIFLWKSTDRDDARRLADVGGIDSALISRHARTLGAHEFIYVGTRGTETNVVRSQVRI